MFPVKTFRKLMKKYTGKRVSEEAAKELANYVEEKISKLFKEAAVLAKHAGRATVLESDIKLAKKNLNL